jgi:hypothetical protein
VRRRFEAALRQARRVTVAWTLRRFYRGVSTDECPGWVNRVGLTLRRPLPVYPQLRTCRCTELSDAMCQKRKPLLARRSILRVLSPVNREKSACLSAQASNVFCTELRRRSPVSVVAPFTIQSMPHRERVPGLLSRNRRRAAPWGPRSLRLPRRLLRPP